MTIYIAGPMSGKPNYNYDEFNKHAKILRDGGRWGDVINPAEGFGGDQSLPRDVYLRQALRNLAECDAIYLLDGWETSEGATMELAIANTIGLKRVFPDEGSGYTKAGRAASVRCIATDGVISIDDDSVVTRSAQMIAPDAFTQELDAIKSLHDAKKADYTGGQHPLANYAFSAHMVGLAPHVGMFQRLCEKVFRLHSLIMSDSDPQVKDESFTDTLQDIAIIAILMRLALGDSEYSTFKPFLP